MNKKLTAFLETYHFTVEGNVARGQYNGYEINLSYEMFDNVAPIKIHFSCHIPEQAMQPIGQTLKQTFKRFFRYSLTPFGLMIGINNWTLNKLLDSTAQVLDFVTQLLKNNNVESGCCPVCGKPLDEDVNAVYNTEQGKIAMHEKCSETVNKNITEENTQFAAAPNNYLKGFAGALLGGIIGGALCVGIYMAGYISTISAIVAVLLGAFFYKLFGGKPTWVMVVIVLATSVACMIISLYALYIVVAGLAAAKYDLGISYFEAFSICMDNSEFADTFYRDLIMLVVFSAIGAALMIFSLLNQIKRRKTINK